jgi:hypothetical protein
VTTTDVKKLNGNKKCLVGSEDQENNKNAKDVQIFEISGEQLQCRLQKTTKSSVCHTPQ